ncbi:MAG: diaminopimelate epimerase [Clostridiales bacterium]|jgi:diaminopimelate epimerase|nr:diaminopimelate epimerase [Clostridiales bacterium]
MKLPFIKMHGCGNDYIYIDLLDKALGFDPAALSVTLSDRHFSIGGDGIVLIMDPDTDAADAKMRMFNNDGSEGLMCGNAIRCVAKRLCDTGRVSGDEVLVQTLSGTKKIRVRKERGECVECVVDMGPASFEKSEIPTLHDGELFLAGESSCQITCVSMGNPHAVVFLETLKNPPLYDQSKGISLENLDLAKIGPLFEKSPLFPKSVNTEFLAAHEDSLDMRVWERGSGETMACGTGACAAVAASVKLGKFPEGKEVAVNLRGGVLKITCANGTVYLAGNCVKAFEGVVEIG